MQPTATPDYPFFTRYGDGQFHAYLCDRVNVYVSTPASYYRTAEIRWNREAAECDGPLFVNSHGFTCEVLITRAEFMVAYAAADAFLAEAEREFLAAPAVALASKAQHNEILRLLGHPVIMADRRKRSRGLLALNHTLTADAAVLEIAALTAYIEAHEEGTYAVVGEAYKIAV